MSDNNQTVSIGVEFETSIVSEARGSKPSLPLPRGHETEGLRATSPKSAKVFGAPEEPRR